MDNNKMPNVGTIFKRGLIALLALIFIIALINGIRSNSFQLLLAIGIVVGLFLIALFIRLCSDVHKIAEHLSEKSSKDDVS